HEPALSLPFGERRRARVSEARILQELVVRDQGVARGPRAPPCQRTCRHHRCSPFHGGSACPAAYPITRSLIFSRTHSKFASLIEKLSKSGAGLSQSIAYSSPSRSEERRVGKECRRRRVQEDQERK